MKYTLFPERTWSFTRATLLFLSLWALIPIHLNDSYCISRRKRIGRPSSTLLNKRDALQIPDSSRSVSSRRNIFFSYGSGRYKAALKRILKEANSTGVFDEIIGFGPEDIDPEYRIAHSDILNATRGGGYWLWKPYFLQKLFSRLDFGDVVMYADAGCEFINSPQVYIDLARRYGFVGFRLQGLSHNQFTKGDVFLSLEMEMDTFGSADQMVGGIWLFQKNPLNERFISDWLRFSEDAQLITDAPSIAPNHENFGVNRHDQSIFGLLVIKYNLSLVLNDQTYPLENSPVIFASRRTD